MGNTIDWEKYDNASLDEKTQMLKVEAEKGDAICQLGYGCMLKKDSPTEARRWFESSAKQGLDLAKYALALVMTSKDRPQPLLLFKEIAEKGCVSSMFALGMEYEIYSEEGRIPNYQRAMECYLNVISCQDNIDWLKSQLGPLFESEIIDMLYLDKECLVGAAEHRIAMIYLDGNGVEKNPKTALGWLKKSSDLKCWHGRYTLGYILAKGAYGIERDKEKAKQLLESLLDDNHSDCKSEKIRYALSLCE